MDTAWQARLQRKEEKDEFESRKWIDADVSAVVGRRKLKVKTLTQGVVHARVWPDRGVCLYGSFYVSFSSSLVCFEWMHFCSEISVPHNSYAVGMIRMCPDALS